MLEFSDAPYRFFEAKPSRPIYWLGRVVNRFLFLPSKAHQIREIEILGEMEAVKVAYAAGDRLLFVINHPTHSDAQVLSEVQRRLGVRACFMAAYDVFLRSKFHAWCMQRFGNFSIDREGSDRKALAAAVHVLKSGESALNIFPEGNVYLSNDRLTPFLDGAAFIALKAQAGLEDGAVKIVPVSLKFTHLTEPRAAVTMRMQQLAKDSGYIFPEGAAEDPMRAVMGLGHHILRGLLSAHGFSEEMSGRDVSLFVLLENFAQGLVEVLEEGLHISAPVGDLSGRIGAIRSKIHALRISEENEGDLELMEMADRAILALRIHGYITPYLTERPTVDRYAETVERIAEDFYSKVAPRKGPRRAMVKIHTPISVSEMLQEAGVKTRSAIFDITKKLEEVVQGGIDELNLVKNSPGARQIEGE